MDEDVEFRDMVLKKLEENGSLLEIKAKLRAHLYDVIENDGRQQQQEVINDSDLTTFNGDKTEEGDEQEQQQPEEEVDDRTVALSLVLDLLECLKMPFTKRVLLAESGLRRPCSRDRLQRELGLAEQEEKEALLLQLIRNRKSTSEISQVSRDQSESTVMTTPAASEESPP